MGTDGTGIPCSHQSKVSKVKKGRVKCECARDNNAEQTVRVGMGKDIPAVVGPHSP